jgi:hypothetical protein
MRGLTPSTAPAGARETPRRARALKRVTKLLRDTSGIAVIELAICFPPLLFMGMYGLELMNLATVNLQVSQIALSLADNASRLGQTDNSGVKPTISESDIDSVMTGALKQGETIDIAAHGKIILSSLEKDTAGNQYIHWQRCRGSLERDSSYGDDGDNNGLDGDPITGLGSGTQKVTAQTDSAVMFVEVYYTYQNLFGDLFVSNTQTIKREAAYVIRDDRELLQDATTKDPKTTNPDGLSGTRNAADTCA